MNIDELINKILKEEEFSNLKLEDVKEILNIIETESDLASAWGNFSYNSDL